MIKSPGEIEIMKRSGLICAEALKEVLAKVAPGVSCRELDKVAQEKIQKKGSTPSFQTVDSYAWTICATVNEQVVHGIPTERKLQEGDILGIDIGALYEGYHSDLAISVPVGTISRDKKKFLEVGEKTLEAAISNAMVGSRVGDISVTIQQMIEAAGYRVVKSLTGHGVGKELHEEPMIPGFGKAKTGPVLLENMVLAIEVIYTNGTGKVHLEEDGWTITATDGSLGGLFEKTVQITQSGPIVLTPYL